MDAPNNLTPSEAIEKYGLYQSIKLKLIEDYSSKIYTDYCPLTDMLIWNNRVGDVLEDKIPIKAKSYVDMGILKQAASKMNFYRKQYKQVIAGIQRRIATRRERLFLIYYNFEDDYFYIGYSYHPALLDLFDNTANKLSGVTEYMPRSFERRTNDLGLVREIIEKADKILGNSWDMHLLAVKDVENARHYFHRHDRESIEEVRRHMINGRDLYPAQYQALRDYITFQGDLINGSEVGFGKCVITLAYAVLTKKPILVVCPKIVTRTWTQEAQKFFGNYFKDIIVDKKTWHQIEEHNLVITHFEAFRETCDEIPSARFETICIDECTKIKHLHTKITRAFMRTREKFKHKLLLSGTYVDNKKSDAYPQLIYIKGTDYIGQDELNMMPIGTFWHKIKRDVYIRYTQSDLGIFIPGKITNITDVGPIGIKDRIIENIGDFTRFRVETAMKMAPHTVEFAQHYLDTSDATLIIATEFTEVAKEINRLIPGSRLHHGKLKDDVRFKLIADFMAGKFRTFVTTRPSIAMGVTVTCANIVLLNDLPMKPTLIEQIEGRAARTGQTRVVFSHWMSASDSLLCKGIQEMIYSKYCTSKALTQGKQLTQEEIDQFNSPIPFWELINQNNARLGYTKKVVIPCE